MENNTGIPINWIEEISKTFKEKVKDFSPLIICVIKENERFYKDTNIIKVYSRDKVNRSQKGWLENDRAEFFAKQIKHILSVDYECRILHRDIY